MEFTEQELIRIRYLAQSGDGNNLREFNLDLSIISKVSNHLKPPDILDGKKFNDMMHEYAAGNEWKGVIKTFIRKHKNKIR